MTRILTTTALALLAGQAVAQPLPSPNFLTPQASDSSSRAATTEWVRSLASGAVTSAQVAAALGYTPLMSGGDVSANMVLAVGSSVGRSEAARAAVVFNVLDYGAVADGSTDIGPALNLIASKLGAGKSNVILIPAGNYRLASAVVFNGVAPILQGQGFTAGPSPQSGTWITIDRTGFVPFTFSGTNARGAVVRDIAIRQAQPAVGAGWAPTGYDYVFKVLNALGEVTFDNLLFAGVTRGIYADYSGRLHIRNVAGQFYIAGIEIDDCYDIPRIEYLHAWTYQTSDPNVLAWQEANLDTIILRRVDGIFLGDIFSLAARSVLHLTAGANGVTTKFYLNNLYADFVTYGVWIDAPGVTGQIANATTQHNDFTAPGTSLPGSTGLLIDTTGVSVQIGNWRTQLAQSSGLTVRQSGNRLDIASLAVNGFDNLNDGSPAISVADSGGATTNVVNILGQPNFTGGGTGPAVNIGNAAVARAALMNLPGGAVNEPRLYAAASGNPVSLAPVGPDANVDLYVGAKGSTGSLRLRAQNSTVVRLDSPGPGDTDLLFRSATAAVSGIAESASANADILLSSKGPTSSVRLQSQGITSLRTASPGPGDSDLYVLGGSGAVSLIAEGAPASVSLSLASKGSSGQVALQSNGGTVLVADSPGPGTSDLRIRSGAGAVSLTVEDAAANANLVLNPKGSGTVVVPTLAISDNSANAASTAWVKSLGYLTSAPVATVAGRIGAVTLTVGDVAGAAPLASPALTGVPTAPTATGGTNSAQLATTAFVGAAVTAAGAYTLPAATASTLGGVRPDGMTIANSSGGISVVFGTVANTAAQGNDSRITGALPAATAASTYYLQTNPNAFITASSLPVAASVTPLMDGTAAVGISATYMRADAVHPTDTTLAPLASPALTGVPVSPTATAGTNTTQIATTAFVGTAIAAIPPAPVTSVATRTGAVVLVVSDVAGAAPSAAPILTGTTTHAGSANNVLIAGSAAGNGVTVSASGTDASVDLLAAAQGSAGSVRLRANGVTVLRTDSPGAGTSDLLIRSGSGTVALTVEGGATNANLALNPQGTGTVVVPTAATADSSTTAASTAFVKAQGYLASGVLAVDSYTASGTWTKNAKATYIRAILIGCGSSGGGGVAATVGTAYSGGAGGSAATALVIEGPASQFTTGSLTLCAASAGGAAGSPGVAGGNAVWNGITAYGGGASSAGAASVTAASGGSGGLRSGGGNASGATVGVAGTDMGAAGSNVAGNSATVSIPGMGGTGGAGLTSGVGSGGYVLSGPTGGGAGGYMAAAQALTSGGSGGPIRNGIVAYGGATAGAPGAAGANVPEGYGAGGGGGGNNIAGVGGIGGAGAVGAGGGGGGNGSTGGGAGGAGGGPLLRVLQW